MSIIDENPRTVIKVLKADVYELLERESDNLLEIRKSGNSNTVGEGMAMGAHEAYNEVLNLIEAIECESK